MNAAQLLEQLDRLSESPGAVPRLRRFILDLAMRGKLVEQDPSDEPAPELLERIQQEKAQLVKAGEIRNVKPPLPLDEEDLFPIPKNWCWSQLAKVGFINPRNKAADDVPASFVPMTLISTEYGVSSKHEVRPWGEMKSGFTHFADGDVALAKITPCFENGKSVRFRDLTGGLGAGTTELHVVRPVFLAGDYVLIFLKSPHFIESGIPRMTGTAGQKRVPTDYFAYTSFPLPPLPEQHRIVAKVDELMVLCDRLEAAQAEREKRRDRLAVVSLHRLNQPGDADDSSISREDARSYLSHLARFTARPDQIPALRETVLNLAVRGKLVRQSQEGSTVPDFENRDSVDGDDRLDMELREGWAWAKVEDVAEARLGKMLDKAKNSGKSYRYLRNTNVHWFDMRTDDLKDLRIQETEVEKYLLRYGDVLICEGGHGIGRTAVWRRKETDVIFQKALHRVRPGPRLDSDFFAYCLFVYFHAGVLQTYFTGVGIPHFTGKALSVLVFPLPPLAEQHRIVAKVDELMALCDKLEAQLTTTRTESRHLLDAVLHGALAAGH